MNVRNVILCKIECTFDIYYVVLLKGVQLSNLPFVICSDLIWCVQMNVRNVILCEVECTFDIYYVVLLEGVQAST